MHTLLDLRGTIPAYVANTLGRVHDVRMLDGMLLAKNTICTMDKAYTDFRRLHRLHQQRAFFVIRAKDNLRFKCLYSASKYINARVRADQTIDLVIPKSKTDYPASFADRAQTYCAIKNATARLDTDAMAFYVHYDVFLILSPLLKM